MRLESGLEVRVGVGRRILSYLKAPFTDRFILRTVGPLWGPMRTCDSLDSGAQSDTGEGEFKNGYRSTFNESTTLRNEQSI